MPGIKYLIKHDRRGTLWMDRFKSVLVENGEALRTMAAYIDLNPVRAGIVEDLEDYRWCGYAEAMTGSKQARRRLCRVMEKPLDSWGENHDWSRCWLIADAGEVQKKKTSSLESNQKKTSNEPDPKTPSQNQGQVSLYQQLRSRIRYFTAWLIFARGV